MEENRLKKSLDDKIEGLQNDLKKRETQLTTLKTVRQTLLFNQQEYSSYVDKNNLLKAEKKEWEEKVKSLDSTLHISSFTKRKLDNAKPILTHLSDYVSSWCNDLSKEFKAAFQAIQHDPDFRRLFTALESFFNPIRAYFTQHIKPIRDCQSSSSPLVSPIFSPVLKPFKTAASFVYQKILTTIQISNC